MAQLMPNNQSPELSGATISKIVGSFLSVGGTALPYTHVLNRYRECAPPAHTLLLLALFGVAKMQLGTSPQFWGNTVISSIFVRLIFTRGSHALSASLASLRWRRLISFSRAVTTNCPVLSPSLFSNSTDSATWCGTRTSNLFDLALMDLVAMTQVLVIRCPTIIYEKKAMAILDVSDTYKYYVSDTLILLKCKNSEARQCANTNRASDHNVIEAYIMADHQHTQTHPKFTWRFLALSSAECNVVHIPANTEREAREQSPAGCVMVFAGRLAVREVRHEHA